MGIRHKRVAPHRERIMKKPDLHSHIELVKVAICSGSIDV